MDFRHILVTGGAGFIGSNFIRMTRERHPDLVVTNLDLLTYSGNRENLADLEKERGEAGEPRYRFVQGDIRDRELVTRLLNDEASVPVDGIVHFAAESHVDRSIVGPEPFVHTNVHGTLVLLDCVRDSLERNPRKFRFLHVSTDEVYGSLGPDDPPFDEALPLLPNSPYAASKAASDLMVRAYHETFRLPVVTTRCSNNYGPYQYPEKLIPLMLTRAMYDQPLPVYGDGKNVRDWIYVGDHCDGIWAAFLRGEEGAAYNLGGECELSNLDVIHTLLHAIDKPHSLIEFVNDRLGHDRRYAMNVDLARKELDWQPKTTFEEGVKATIEWYQDNRDWWLDLLPETESLTAKLYGR